MLSGLEAKKVRRRRSSRTPEGRRIRELEKEVRRKDAALAETAALLVLKKKPRPSLGPRTTTRSRGETSDSRSR